MHEQLYLKLEILISSSYIQIQKFQILPYTGITLGPKQTDLINQMIPLTDTHFG